MYGNKIITYFWGTVVMVHLACSCFCSDTKFSRDLHSPTSTCISDSAVRSNITRKVGKRVSQEKYKKKGKS